MIKNTLKLMFVFFFLAGSFTGCMKKVTNDDEVVLDEVKVANDNKAVIDPSLSDRMVVTNPQEVILGKWDRIADAMYVDRISERADGIYWEFIHNGTIHYNIPRSGPNDSNVIVNTATFTVDEDLLVCRSDWSGEERYKYGFYENGKKLILVRADWIPSSSPPDGVVTTDIYLANIFIYQRKN